MINEDITKPDIKEIFGEYKNIIDVVIGGPPCQGFSQRSRKTIHDERNFLFDISIMLSFKAQIFDGKCS